MAMAVSHQQSRDAALLRATTELFVLESKHDPDGVRRFEELATHFLGKVSAADRAFVAERLARAQDAPTSVLRLLGKDLIEIASPILRRSEQLSELDLLSIISCTGPAHHRQIATRPHLPAPVVTALRLAGDAETASLLKAHPESAAAGPPPAPGVAAAPKAAAPRAEALEAVKPADAPAVREVFAAARAMTAALGAELATLSAGPLPAARAAEAEASAEEATQPAQPAAEDEVTWAPADDAPVAADTGTSAAAPQKIARAVPGIAEFLALDSRGRIEQIARIGGRVGPADPGMTLMDADNAFRVALGSARVSRLARRRQRDALVTALAHGLRLDVGVVTELVDDPSGEALVVLLRAIGLSEEETHQVLLFANPSIAEAVDTFFRLARLVGETDREAAEIIVGTWRGDARRPAGHQPVFSNLELRRTVHGAAASPAAAAAAERLSAG